MTTPHKHADILRAIADGKEVQVQNAFCKWEEGNLPLLADNPDATWRVKPDTIVVNGVEVPRLGDEWPEHHGIYAGIARGFDGEPDAHLVLLHDVELMSL